MHRPRMTIRQVMVVVAIVAISLTAEVTRRRWVQLAAEYRNRAVMHSKDAAVYQHVAALTPYVNAPATEQDQAKIGRQIAHELRLADKYGYAVAHLWLPVPPDPPAPE